MKCKAEYETFVALEMKMLFACRHLPDFDYAGTAIFGPASQIFGIRAEDNAPNDIGMTFQGADQFSSSRVPQLNGLVGTRGGDPASVRAHANTPDGVRVTALD